jgi:Putative DNA-binding domain
MSQQIPEQINSQENLRALQRVMAGLLFRPLNADWNMQAIADDGKPVDELAASFIKPNRLLTSFERLEIYNRQYWFRVLDVLYDDYPGLCAVLGEAEFTRIRIDYLAKFPSNSFTLRDLGSRMEEYLRASTDLSGQRRDLAIDMVRLEWAHVVAFDGPSALALAPDALLGRNPEELKLSLQPYLTLLDLAYPVDDLLAQVKEENKEALRKEASNAVQDRPDLPETNSEGITVDPETVFLVVHRFDNQVYLKRIERDAFRLLHSIQEGKTLGTACADTVADSQRPVEEWPELLKSWFEEWSQLGWFCER